jgi:hypothetical protein
VPDERGAARSGARDGSTRGEFRCDFEGLYDCSTISLAE